jgi:hypothetical protein
MRNEECSFVENFRRLQIWRDVLGLNSLDCQQQQISFGFCDEFKANHPGQNENVKEVVLRNRSQFNVFQLSFVDQPLQQLEAKLVVFREISAVQELQQRRNLIFGILW